MKVTPVSYTHLYSSAQSQALEDFVKEGSYVSAVGFVSHDAEGNRLRVRDRSEILTAEAPAAETFDVTFALTGGSAEGSAVAEKGQDYTVVLKALDGYELPNDVIVTVGGDIPVSYTHL